MSTWKLKGDRDISHVEEYHDKRGEKEKKKKSVVDFEVDGFGV